MAVVITGNNTPTAGGVTYGDGTTYANTAAGMSGQLLQSNGSSAPSWVTVSAGPTLGTVVATTSGTTAEFTGIPSTAKQIIVNFNQVGWGFGASMNPYLQVSTSSTYLTSGYVGRMATLGSTNTAPDALSTAIVLGNSSYIEADNTLSGALTMTLLNASTNTWAGSSSIAVNGSNNRIFLTAFTFALASPLNKLKMFDQLGATFSNGSINIAYL
jgi:hypothetical protein